PKKTENLLVAGRCFCFEDKLVEDTRIIGTCLVTGQGAGAAAGLAVKERVKARDLNISKLKQLLKDQGAWLG
ncbi:MAG: FAD-dependent oxidoreductase, partial [Bacteroidales bacterium]|nr:FAD-dependent oxidoreductase [Bacteroidales bacterium]